MPNLLIALAIVVGGIWFIRKMARTPSSGMPALTKKFGGIGLIAVAALLFLRGNTTAALPLLLLGLTMVGISHPWAQQFNWKPRESGQSSRVATSVLEMELNHGSGRMDGTVKTGPLAGRKLSSLAVEELRALHSQSQAAPDQSQALMEAWLDRMKPGWRNAWNYAGQASGGVSGKMTPEEAYSVLGLKTGATADDIKQAHRRLMKDYHPDKGGSDYLAAKINQAKDVLLDS